MWEALTPRPVRPLSNASLRRGPRPRGTVRAALVEAGLELARTGGPDAVVLREVTRMVGVVPNAAYRHFADRDAFLAAVRDAAVGRLAQRMADGMRRVHERRGTPAGARGRMRAVGQAYLAVGSDRPQQSQHWCQTTPARLVGPLELLPTAGVRRP